MRNTIVVNATAATIVLITVAAAVYNFSRLQLWMSSANSSKQQNPCSFDQFRNYIAKTGTSHVTGRGNWMRTADGDVDRFQPEICTFQYGRTLPRGFIADCVHRTRIDYIAIIGDSNALGAFHGFTAVLDSGQNASELTCRDASKDSTFPNRRCVCTHPICLLAVCDLTTSAGSHRRLLIEYFPHYSLVSNVARNATAKTLKMYSTMGIGCWDSKRKTFATGFPQNYSRFVLHTYLRNPRPDLLIVMENSHDHYAIDRHAETVEKYAKLLDDYVSAGMPRTKVLWVTKIAEHPPRKPLRWKTVRSLEYNNATNYISHRVLAKRFVRTKDVLLFLDQLEMSAPLQVEWSLDGVHMNAMWYKHLASYILQTVCKSSTYDFV